MKLQPCLLQCLTLLFVITLTGMTACEGPAATDEQIYTQRESISAIATDGFYTNPNAAHKDAGVFFNPQPEPPARIFEFETIGMPGEDWSGQFRNTSTSGRIRVEILSSVQRGRTVHLKQLWTLHPPDPIHPVVQVMLKGILNLAKNKLVLNGMVEEEGMRFPMGTQVHVRGQFVTEDSGAISVGGKLMFNPQPEPPAQHTLNSE